MLRKETHKLPSAYKGTVQAVMTAGHGTPCADPRLEVVYTEGYAPEGLDVVSNAGVAVGINKDGFLEPATVKKDGEKVTPYGIIADCLLGTACMYGDAVPGEWDPVPTQFNGQATMGESLHQMTPTVYQAATLFEVGRSFKTTGKMAEIFKIKVGDLLRPISEAELEEALKDTLPEIKLGGKKLSAEKKKAFYKGMLVKFGSDISGITPKTANDLEMKCARVAAFVDPGHFENKVYNGQWCFEYDVQGPGTDGQSRNVWNGISEVRHNAEYTQYILQYYTSM